MVVQPRHVALLLLASVAAASAVTPVEKVIALLDGMKTDIENEGKAEAAVYAKQSCFCKTQTMKKSKQITNNQDRIDKLSAAIADNTATKVADETKKANLKDQKEKLSNDLDENTARCAAEKAEYEKLAADFNKAISSLKSAIKTMADKKTAIGKVASASLLEVKTGIQETLELAEAMGFVAPKQKTMKAFLQQGESVDPDDADYKYHSDDIVQLLESLKKDFTSEKSTLDSEYGKTEASCTNLKKSLAGKIKTNGDETSTVSGKINKLETEIADDRGKLVNVQDEMQDDERFLKGMTSSCERYATTFDQRVEMREGEVKALSGALAILNNKVKGADTAVNKRAFMQQQQQQQQPAKAAKDVKAAEPKKVTGAVKAVATPVKKVEEPKKALSFLQRTVVNVAAQEQLMRDQVATAVHDAGVHLGSPMLTALSMRIAANPFKKIKGLIQGLIERLITEAAAEATKKGFCDTELGKARRDREYRWTQVEKLQAQVDLLVSEEDSLKEEIKGLTKALDVLDKAVKRSTNLRNMDKKDNEETLIKAREGLAAVSEALMILKSFYKESAKAEGSVEGEELGGAYTGKQDSSSAVLGLLETIVSDFDRTIRTTESDEQSAAEAYVKFQRDAKVDIAGKTTQKRLQEQELKTTQNLLKVKNADHKTNMDLVDAAVKAILDLKPTCIDSGMSYAERVEKREDEVKALKKALCILDTESVEDECKGAAKK